MKDKILILNIQLFAENGISDAGECGNEEFGIRNSEFGIDDVGYAFMRTAENGEALNDEKEESIVNEEVESDVLDDEATNEEEKENINEETEDSADSEERFIREREERLRNRISGWLKESGKIKEVYPDFDLRRELRSSELFSQLVLAGAPLKASYEIVHKDEIISGAMAYTADKVREQVVKNIEAKGRRPLENGISSESAVMTAVDVNALTAKDIHKILKQVENGASIKF